MTIQCRRARRAMGGVVLAGSLAVAGGCGISTQQEVEMGGQYASQINQQLPIVQDRAVNYYINELGNSIARRVDPRGIQYTFRVVNAPEVNAFAVPGGHVYINRGLIERASNMSELAGVLAHEIAHVAERHSVERMERAQGANLLAAILLGSNPSGIAQVGAQIGGTAVFAHYSRDAEREADREAVRYLSAVGINPNGLVTMFRKLLAERERAPGRVERFFSTHPLTEERVTVVQQEIAALPGGARGATDTRAFVNFRSRVRGLPAARR